jgi:CelD/BcsL family acetyltransferase involved in cellulose biosynthesis
VSDPRWAAVEALPDATLYHSTAWIRVLAETYRFVPHCYVALDDERIVGGCPGFEVRRMVRARRFVSVPFSDVGGPIGDAPAKQLLAQCIATDAAQLGWQRVEIRAPLEGDARRDFAEQIHNDLYVVPLDRPLCDIVRDFSDSVRWGRKRALREGLTVARAHSRAVLREFYRLHEITRRKLGVPVQPWRFFEALWREFFARDAGFVITVRQGRAAVASAVFLRHGRRLYYKFSASDPRALASQPNSLVLWEAVTWAQQAGLAAVDLGKTVRENTGLARFKRSWGAIAAPLPYSYFPRVAGVGAESEESPRMQALRAVWRRLPLPVARVASAVVYRSLV